MKKLNTFVNVKIVFRVGDELLYFTSTDGHKNLPGGHLEHGEQPLDGLYRELREELDYELPFEPRALGAWTHTDQERDLHRITIAYLHDLHDKVDFHWQGGPQDENFEAFVWIKTSDIEQQQFSPKLLEIMKRASLAPHQ